MSDFDDVMSEDCEKLSDDEKYRIKISRLSPQEFDTWKRDQIARGDLIKRKDAAEAGGAGAPVLSDYEREVAAMDGAEFQDHKKSYGIDRPRYLKPTLSEANKLYRKKIGFEK